MRSIALIVVTGGLALGLLFVSDRMLEPVPVPAALMVFGALIGLGMGRYPGFTRVIAGMAGGLLAGVGHHLYVHFTGQSPYPAEGLALHLAYDGVVGLLVALSIVVVVLVAYKLLNDALLTNVSHE